VSSGENPYQPPREASEEAPPLPRSPWTWRSTLAWIVVILVALLYALAVYFDLRL
jgi:hypothetical protein